MMSADMKERLERYRDLVSEALPGADLAQVLDDALKLAIAQRERRKFGLTTRPRKPRTSARPRTIPAHVRRAVHERDGGRCTFVSVDGHRCGSRSHLQFDHIKPIACGGASVPENLRLRCRTHNQLEAERMFGTDFMQQKRAAAAEAAERERLLDCIAALRTLGCRAEQARNAAERTNSTGLTLEQHVRAALRLTCAARRVQREPAA
jgi:5-methylcytosine-specific restriction endonuclease McrA